MKKPPTRTAFLFHSSLQLKISIHISAACGGEFHAVAAAFKVGSTVIFIEHHGLFPLVHSRNGNLGIQSLSCCDSNPLAPYLAHKLAIALYGDVAVGGVHKGYDDLLLALFSGSNCSA